MPEVTITELKLLISGYMKAMEALQQRIEEIRASIDIKWLLENDIVDGYELDDLAGGRWQDDEGISECVDNRMYEMFHENIDATKKSLLEDYFRAASLGDSRLPSVHVDIQNAMLSTATILHLLQHPRVGESHMHGHEEEEEPPRDMFHNQSGMMFRVGPPPGYLLELVPNPHAGSETGGQAQSGDESAWETVSEETDSESGSGSDAMDGLE